MHGSLPFWIFGAVPREIYQTLRLEIYVTCSRNDDDGDYDEDEDDEDDDDGNNSEIRVLHRAAAGEDFFERASHRQRGKKRDKNGGARARACNPTDVASAKSESDVLKVSERSGKG